MISKLRYPINILRLSIVLLMIILIVIQPLGFSVWFPGGALLFGITFYVEEAIKHKIGRIITTEINIDKIRFLIKLIGNNKYEMVFYKTFNERTSCLFMRPRDDWYLNESINLLLICYRQINSEKQRIAIETVSNWLDIFIQYSGKENAKKDCEFLLRTLKEN